MSRLAGNVTPAKAWVQCRQLELPNDFKEAGFRPLYENTRPAWIVLSAFPRRTACCPNRIEVKNEPFVQTTSPRRRPGSRVADWNYPINSKILDSGLRRNDESWLRSFPRSCVGMQALFLWATGRGAWERGDTLSRLRQTIFHTSLWPKGHECSPE